MKKFLFAVFAGAMLFLTGCKKDDTLKVSMAATFPPFEYKEGTEYKGVDVEIAKEIAKRIGKKIEYADMEFDSVLSSLSSGNVDFSASGLTINAVRSKVVDFSIPYFDAAQVIIIRKGDLEDLRVLSNDKDALIRLINNKKGIKIGVQTGTTGALYAKGDSGWGFAGFKDADVKNFVNGAMALSALLNKQIDLIILDEMPAKLLSKASGQTDVLDTSLTDEKYGIAVKKGNKALLDSINTHLEAMQKDGTLDKIITKYFGGN